MGVVKNIMVRAVADFSQLSTESKKAQRQLNELERDISGKMSSISTGVNGMANGLKGAIAGLSMALAPSTLGLSLVVGAALTVIGSAMATATDEAIRYESALTQLNFTLGEHAKGVSSWGASKGASVGLSETQVATAGAQYGNLISKFVADQGVAAKYTQELIQQTAVIASRTGRTQEDVIERIRSGLLGETEAVEDLGIMVNVSMLESTKAFKEMAGGKHWEQLNFHQQQQIRLAAILEQSYSSYGDKLADTTASSLNKLKAEWNNLVLYIGNAFLPVFKKIVDGTTWVLSIFSRYMKLVSAFYNAVFGGKEPPFRNRTDKETKAIMEQTKAVDDLDGKIKKVNKSKKDSTYLFGFDQITQIPSKDSGGSDAMDGASTFSGIGDSAIENGKKVDEFSDKMTKLTEGFKKLGEGYNSLLKGDLKGALTKWAEGIGTIWGAFMGQEKGKKLTEGIKKLGDAYGLLFKGDFKGFASKFSDGMKSIKSALFGTGSTSKIVDAMVNFYKAAYNLQVMKDPAKAMRDMTKGIKDLYSALKGTAAGELLKKIWNQIAREINNAVGSLNTLIGKMKNVSVLGAKPFKGLDYLSFRVPYLAKGGIIDSPTLAMVGEAGKEAVMPLENNTGWIDDLAGKIAQKMGGSGMGGGGDVIVQIGGKEFGRFAINEINKANRQAGRNLIKV